VWCVYIALLVRFDDGQSSPISLPDRSQYKYEEEEDDEESMGGGISLSLCTGPSPYVVVISKLFVGQADLVYQ
jgi:hypothetical protein